MTAATTLWGAITAVWTEISTWLTSTISSLESIFYDASSHSLTFLGTLGIIALGISVIFLLIGWIRSLALKNAIVNQVNAYMCGVASCC